MIFSGFNIISVLLVTFCWVTSTQAYSAYRDAKIIAQYKRELELNHAKISRELVHRANWASMGSISTNDAVKNYPMVNVIAVDDNNAANVSTGIIRFLLTDLDFTGPDWQANNKVTMTFTDEQSLNCQKANKDPMEPTCARVMISGQVKRLAAGTPSYQTALDTFIIRHPAAVKWLKTHNFYLCELDIQNIFELDYYGGPNTIKPSDYYAVQL